MTALGATSLAAEVVQEDGMWAQARHHLSCLSPVAAAAYQTFTSSPLSFDEVLGYLE